MNFLLQYYKSKKKKTAWLDTCLLYSAQAELHYSLSDYNVSILLSSYPSWTWDGYAYCALVSGGRVSSWGLPFRLWSLHSRLLTREKNSTASFFHHFRQYSRSISGEGKSRLAGNYEAAVLLRPQSPRDFYGPFQEVVRNRTTVQYHKKRRGRRGRRRKKNILAVNDDPWHARFYGPRWRMQSITSSGGHDRMMAGRKRRGETDSILDRKKFSPKLISTRGGIKEKKNWIQQTPPLPFR